MTEPRLAYNSATGEVFVLRLPESLADLGKPTEFFKVGALDPGLSEEEAQRQMLEVLADLG
jgi:hypothetical protein